MNWPLGLRESPPDLPSLGPPEVVSPTAHPKPLLMHPLPFDEQSLRDVLDRLSSPHQLNGHPWAAALGAAYRQAHLGTAEVPAGEALGRALADLWAERFRPGHVAPEFKTDWHTYFVLEVMCFYPFRARGTFPSTLPRLATFLANQAHLQLALADGDEARAGVRRFRVRGLLGGPHPGQRQRRRAREHPAVASGRGPAEAHRRVERRVADPRRRQGRSNYRPIHSCPDSVTRGQRDRAPFRGPRRQASPA